MLNLNVEIRYLKFSNSFIGRGYVFRILVHHEILHMIRLDELTINDEKIAIRVEMPYLVKLQVMDASSVSVQIWQWQDGFLEELSRTESFEFGYKGGVNIMRGIHLEDGTDVAMNIRGWVSNNN
jgi:hypothetical protein